MGKKIHLTMDKKFAQEEEAMVKHFQEHENDTKSEFKAKVRMMHQYYKDLNQKCSVKNQERKTFFEKYPKSQWHELAFSIMGFLLFPAYLVQFSHE